MYDSLPLPHSAQYPLIPTVLNDNEALSNAKSTHKGYFKVNAIFEK